MGLFRPYNQAAKTPPAPTPEVRAAEAPKSRPTPSREAAQAARQLALHPKLTKRQAAAQDRAAADKRTMQQQQSIEMQPERVLMRNYVDSRLSIPQYALPVLFVMVLGLVFATNYPSLIYIIMLVTYAILIVSIVYIWWFWRGFRRELAERLPNASSRGLAMAMIARITAFPRLRTPAPTIKRGDSY